MHLFRSRRARWLLVLGVVAVALGAAAYAFLAPEPSQRVDEAAPADAMLLRGGEFRDGDPLHNVEGTVRLLRDAEGYVLRFEGYEATPGPDVYFYLTREAGASSAQAVEGEGVRVPTDAATGQATLRGAFNVRLPQGVDPEGFVGVSVWCEDYNVLFGWAELAAPGEAPSAG